MRYFQAGQSPERVRPGMGPMLKDSGRSNEEALRQEQKFHVTCIGSILQRPPHRCRSIDFRVHPHQCQRRYVGHSSSQKYSEMKTRLLIPIHPRKRDVS